MKALSIHAPWAWAIIAGYKRFENRTWSTKHRGGLAIHASKSKASDVLAIDTITAAGIEPPTIVELDAIRGKVIGIVDLIDVVEFDSANQVVKDDPFAVGPFCFVVTEPIEIDHSEALGRLGIWEW